MSVVQNNTISTNSITEATSANGVSIDGLKVKDYSLMYGSNTGLTVSSDGYVTKPNHPAFAAYKDDNAADPNNYTTPIAFDHTFFNQGNHYATTGGNAGKFTCPVTGIYHFYTTVLSSDSAGVFRVAILLNGNKKSGEIRLIDSDYEFASVSATISCATNDLVYVNFHNTNSDIALHGDATPYLTFGGFLIG